jgi:hypothetical protein
LPSARGCLFSHLEAVAAHQSYRRAQSALKTPKSPVWQPEYSAVKHGYRVRQVERKIGRPILQRRVRIELALEIVSVLGIAPSRHDKTPRVFCSRRH